MIKENGINLKPIFIIIQMQILATAFARFVLNSIIQIMIFMRNSKATDVSIQAHFFKDLLGRCLDLPVLSRNFVRLMMKDTINQHLGFSHFRHKDIIRILEYLTIHDHAYMVEWRPISFISNKIYRGIDLFTNALSHIEEFPHHCQKNSHTICGVLRNF